MLLALLLIFHEVRRLQVPLARSFALAYAVFPSLSFCLLYQSLVPDGFYLVNVDMLPDPEEK